MRKILEEDPGLCGRARSNEFLVHIGLPRQALHIGIAANMNETLAPLVVPVPEVLQKAQDPENPAMSL
jgi:hypothetical protein